MAEVRWFAPNRFCALPVPALRRAGLGIALEGDDPARLAVAADGQCAVAALEFSRRHRCPMVLYLWDLPPWRLGEGRPDFVFEIRGSLRRIPRPWGAYPERPGYYSRIGYVATQAIEVWCPSTTTVEDAGRRFGVAARRVPFCYDSDRFGLGTEDRGLGTGGVPTVLSVSRLVPHKNHAVILRAAARLAPRPLVRILGQGPEAANLRRLAAALGVELNLTDSWASDAAILAAYREATVLACPSRFEGFGLTPMEGLAVGIPVIASDIPSHREYLRGAVRFFPPDDDISLARELEKALHHPARRPAAPFPVLTELTIEACAARLLPGLQRILGGTG